MKVELWLHSAHTLLENVSDEASAYCLLSSTYVTKFFTISLYLTKLYVTESFAIASSITYSEIRQNLSNSVPRYKYNAICTI